MNFIIKATVYHISEDVEDADGARGDFEIALSEGTICPRSIETIELKGNPDTIEDLEEAFEASSKEEAKMTNEKSTMITWSCHNCKARHAIEHATDKRTLECALCGATHIVTGLHINGSPIIRLSYRKEVKNGTPTKER